jgi:hypothetical protein
VDLQILNGKIYNDSWPNELAGPSLVSVTFLITTNGFSLGNFYGAVTSRPVTIRPTNG